MENNQSSDNGKIYQAMIAIANDVGVIGKDSRNTGQGYQFRGIDAVMNELHRHFIKHKVIILPEVIESEREERTTAKGAVLIYTMIKCRFTFVADDGSSVSVVTAGEGMDSGDKSTNKAQSSALKYALTQMLLIPTAEPKDVERDNHDVQPRDRNDRSRNANNQTKSDRLNDKLKRKKDGTYDMPPKPPPKPPPKKIREDKPPDMPPKVKRQEDDKPPPAKKKTAGPKNMMNEGQRKGIGILISKLENKPYQDQDELLEIMEKITAMKYTLAEASTIAFRLQAHHAKGEAAAKDGKASAAGEQQEMM